jgi:hypothetical protein
MPGDLGVNYVPLLEKQLEIYAIPRGEARFQEYISAVVDITGENVDTFPLVAMNPMGKEHCSELLAVYLGLNAEETAHEEILNWPLNVGSDRDTLKVSLVLVDDAHGGWTNRIDYECKVRTTLAAVLNKYHWLSVMLWTSETPSEKLVRESVRGMLARAEYVLKHGDPKNLREILTQEGYVQNKSEVHHEILSGEEVEYTRNVLEPHFETDKMSVVVAALFGDAGAASLGYPPLGLEANAGLRLAVSQSSTAVHLP